MAMPASIEARYSPRVGALLNLAAHPAESRAPSGNAPIAWRSAGLDRLGSTLAVRRDRVLLHLGDEAGHYHKVASGALRMVRVLADGRRHIVKFLMAGDFFGFSGSQTCAYAVEAIVDSTVVRYSRRGVEGLIDRDPVTGRRLLSLLFGELSDAQERQLALGRKTAVERVASFLLQMADACSCWRRDSFELPMSRTDIADHLGMTCETVSRTMAQLRRAQVIDLPHVHHVTILDRCALERHAN